MKGPLFSVHSVLPPSPFVLHRVRYHCLKRSRYSVEERKALTISARW
jgi:hypothetical protein